MNSIDPRTGRVVPVWTTSSSQPTQPAIGRNPEQGARSPASPLPFGMPGSGPASQGAGTRAPRQPFHAVPSQAPMPQAALSHAVISRAAMPAAAPPPPSAKVPPLARAPRLPSLDDSCEAALADVWRLIDDGCCRLLASARLPDGTMAREIGVASPDYLAAVAGHEGELAIEDGESAYEYQVLVIEHRGQVASIEVHPSFEPVFVVSYAPAGGALEVTGSEEGVAARVRQILAAVPRRDLDNEVHFKAMLRARILLRYGERWRQNEMQMAAGLSRGEAKALRRQVFDVHKQEATDFLASQQLPAGVDVPAHAITSCASKAGAGAWTDGRTR